MVKRLLGRIARGRTAGHLPPADLGARGVLPAQRAGDPPVELGIDELEARLATDYPGPVGHGGGGSGSGQVGWGC
jgi:hypothetical protein